MITTFNERQEAMVKDFYKFYEEVEKGRLKADLGPNELDSKLDFFQEVYDLMLRATDDEYQAKKAIDLCLFMEKYNMEDDLTQDKKLKILNCLHKDLRERFIFYEIINRPDMWQLVDNSLYNFLGYGNPDSKIWFVELEETGHEIWDFDKVGIEGGLKIRNEFKLNMDARYVWEEIFKVKLEDFNKSDICRYMAAYILAYEGKEIKTEYIRRFLFEKRMLGSLKGNHFICELFPLPKLNKKCIRPYSFRWKSIADYHREVFPKRAEILLENLNKFKEVELIVAYEEKLVRGLAGYFKDDFKHIDSWKFNNREKYELYSFNIGSREVNLLLAPYFEFGELSYAGIKDSLARVKEYDKNK